MPSSHPFLVIQSICTIWTKTSRGGNNASIRNSTPEALEIPVLPFSLAHDIFLLQEVVYHEHDGFQYPRTRLEQKERTDLFRYDCLKFLLSEHTLNITVEWERCDGAPRRTSLPRKDFSLQDHQWGRVAYNLRTAWEGRWMYKKRVLNIGFVTSSSPGIFLETEPARNYENMAKLR